MPPPDELDPPAGEVGPSQSVAGQDIEFIRIVVGVLPHRHHRQIRPNPPHDRRERADVEMRGGGGRNDWTVIVVQQAAMTTETTIRIIFPASLCCSPSGRCTIKNNVYC